MSYISIYIDIHTFVYNAEAEHNQNGHNVTTCHSIHDVYYIYILALFHTIIIFIVGIYMYYVVVYTKHYYSIAGWVYKRAARWWRLCTIIYVWSILWIYCMGLFNSLTLSYCYASSIWTPRPAVVASLRVCFVENWQQMPTMPP